MRTRRTSTDGCPAVSISWQHCWNPLIVGTLCPGHRSAHCWDTIDKEDVTCPGQALCHSPALIQSSQFVTGAIWSCHGLTTTALSTSPTCHGPVRRDDPCNSWLTLVSECMITRSHYTSEATVQLKEGCCWDWPFPHSQWTNNEGVQVLILSRERPEEDVAKICNRRIRHFAKIGSRRRCLRVLLLRTICSWSIVSLTHILTISHGGEFISSVCHLRRKHLPKKEIFPFSFFEGFRGYNCPEKTHLVDIWYIKGISCFSPL